MAGRRSPAISITLSPAQVDEVLHAASRGGASSLSTLISSALSEPGANGGAPAGPRSPADEGESTWPPALERCDRRLSRSLLRGLAILSCFTAERPDRGILEMAHELGLSPSTTHRYVLTLLELGLLERCARSRRYRLPATPD